MAAVADIREQPVSSPTSGAEDLAPPPPRENKKKRKTEPTAAPSSQICDVEAEETSAQSAPPPAARKLSKKNAQNTQAFQKFLAAGRVVCVAGSAMTIQDLKGLYRTGLPRGWNNWLPVECTYTGTSRWVCNDCCKLASQDCLENHACVNGAAITGMRAPRPRDH